MTRLISILIVLLLNSCSSGYDKQEVTEYFNEIKELNQILIADKEKLKWENTPTTISSKIPRAKELIDLLKNRLNLTEIEFHDKINGKVNHIGTAFRFGDPLNEKHISFIIYTQNQEDLESFRHYEQFVDCGKSEIIDNHWAFSRILVDCEK